MGLIRDWINALWFEYSKCPILGSQTSAYPLGVEKVRHAEGEGTKAATDGNQASQG